MTSSCCITVMIPPRKSLSVLLLKTWKLKWSDHTRLSTSSQSKTIHIWHADSSSDINEGLWLSYIIRKCKFSKCISLWWMHGNCGQSSNIRICATAPANHVQSFYVQQNIRRMAMRFFTSTVQKSLLYCKKCSLQNLITSFHSLCIPYSYWRVGQKAQSFTVMMLWYQH